MGVDLSGLIHPDVQQIIFICLEFQPGSTVGNDAGVVGASAVLVHFIFEIDARAAHDLIHDHALGTVDDEGAPLGHQGQFPDENLLFLDLTGFLVDQATGHIHLRREGGIATLGFLHVMPRPLESVFTADEMQLELAGVIGDRGETLQLLDQTLIQKPLKAGPLNLHQIGEIGGGLGDLNRAAAHAGTGREDVGTGRTGRDGRHAC